MLKSAIAVSIAVVAAAGIAASLTVFLTAVAPEAKADLRLEGAFHQPLAKGDRLRTSAKGAACSALGWPHYEPACLFDMRQPSREARTVRVIALR